jgi:hypothetical protein
VLSLTSLLQRGFTYIYTTVISVMHLAAAAVVVAAAAVVRCRAKAGAASAEGGGGSLLGRWTSVEAFRLRFGGFEAVLNIKTTFQL